MIMCVLQYLLPDADGLHGARVLQLQKHVLSVERAALLIRVRLHAPDIPATTNIYKYSKMCKRLCSNLLQHNNTPYMCQWHSLSLSLNNIGGSTDHDTTISSRRPGTCHAREQSTAAARRPPRFSFAQKNAPPKTHKHSSGSDHTPLGRSGLAGQNIL